MVATLPAMTAMMTTSGIAGMIDTRRLPEGEAAVRQAERSKNGSKRFKRQWLLGLWKLSETENNPGPGRGRRVSEFLRPHLELLALIRLSAGTPTTITSGILQQQFLVALPHNELCMGGGIDPVHVRGLTNLAHALEHVPDLYPTSCAGSDRSCAPTLS